MELFILLVLILLNGFFALSEIALVSCKRSRIEHAKAQGNKSAKKVLHLLDDSENFLSAIQVGITLIGIVTGVYGGINIADDVTPFFEGIELINPYAEEVALFLTILVITYISIVIGELVPKTIALGNPDKIALRVAPAIYYFSKLFYPVVKMLSASTNLINRLIGIQKQTEQFTEAELRHMIKLASNEGVIEKEQNILHEKVFYFSDKKAKHIMTHRTDVEWIDLKQAALEIHNELDKVQHSKIVCCDGDPDNFLGIIHLKDYYKSLNNENPASLEKLIIPPLIVPESSDAQYVLDLLRQKHSHLCFVVNEYGGFEGIITLHDIIENIVGQIPEENELYEPNVFVRDDQSVLVSGSAPVETLTEIIEDFTIDFETIEYATVAGFVFNQLDKIPQVGDSFIFMGYKIEVVDVDGRRIDKILITKK